MNLIIVKNNKRNFVRSFKKWVLKFFKFEADCVNPATGQLVNKHPFQCIFQNDSSALQ